MAEEKRPPLADLLRELDEKLEQDGMPVGARNRVELEIRGHERQVEARWRRWLPACTFAAGAALVLVVIGVKLPASEGTDAEEVVAAVAGAPLGAFAVTGDHCESHRAGAGTEMTGDCELVAEHMTVRVWERATVQTGGDGLVVESGSVLFDVEPVRPRDASVKVGVSHGVIEVVGTRFAVAQDDDGGHVDLFEGKIKFHELDGTVVDIRPGQRHGWGEEAPRVAAADVPDESLEDSIEILADEGGEAKTQSRRRNRADRAAELIERVGELRAERRYSEAVRVLRDANKKRWDRRTAQVLSYELGELLHRYVGDKRGACKHLRGHQQRFPSGRYHDAIVRTLEKLSCG